MPYVGRFISKDSIGFLGGFNDYVYAPNPVGWIDPLRLCAKGENNSDSDEIIRVRHYTNRKISNAIEKSQKILAVGNNRVYVEPANKKPGGFKQRINIKLNQVKNKSDIEGYIASKALYDPNNRFPKELKPIEKSINNAIGLTLPCLGGGKKVFSFKTQRQNFPENAQRFGGKIVTIF